MIFILSFPLNKPVVCIYSVLTVLFIEVLILYISRQDTKCYIVKGIRNTTKVLHECTWKGTLISQYGIIKEN